MEAFAFPVLEGEPAHATPTREEALAAMLARAEAAAEEAAARAREEGLAAGLADAEAQLEPARCALVEAARAFEQRVDGAAAETERRAVELALALAEKILHTAIEADPSLVASVATGALRRVVHRDGVVLDVNPADVELVRAATDRIASELGALPRLEVAGERRVPRGGCVVRTPEGEIDARLDTQLARAAALLLEPVDPPA